MMGKEMTACISGVHNEKNLMRLTENIREDIENDRYDLEVQVTSEALTFGTSHCNVLVAPEDTLVIYQPEVGGATSYSDE